MVRQTNQLKTCLLVEWLPLVVWARGANYEYCGAGPRLLWQHCIIAARWEGASARLLAPITFSMLVLPPQTAGITLHGDCDFRHSLDIE